MSPGGHPGQLVTMQRTQMMVNLPSPPLGVPGMQLQQHQQVLMMPTSGRVQGIQGGYRGGSGGAAGYMQPGAG